MHGEPALLGRVDELAQREIQWLLDRETEYLDQGRYREWLELYATECMYWVPAAPGQTDAVDQVSLFYEDRTLMEMRIARLTGGSAHSLELPVRVSHVSGVALLAAVDADTGDVKVTRRFQVTEYQDGAHATLRGALHLRANTRRRCVAHTDQARRPGRLRRPVRSRCRSLSRRRHSVVSPGMHRPAPRHP